MKQFFESCIALGKFIGRWLHNSSWWPFIFIAFIALAGCRGQATYTDGAALQLGVFIPTDTGLTGLQLCDWISGCRVQLSTNQGFKVTRHLVSSNDYFGVVHIREDVTTTIEAMKPAASAALEAMVPQEYIWDTWTLDNRIHTNDVRRIQK